MGDIVGLQSYRASRGTETGAVVAAADPGTAGNLAPPGGVAQACRGMESGMRQMRTALLLLAEASAELCDLVRWEAEQAEAEQAGAEARPDRPQA